MQADFDISASKPPACNEIPKRKINEYYAKKRLEMKKITFIPETKRWKHSYQSGKIQTNKPKKVTINSNRLSNEKPKKMIINSNKVSNDKPTRSNIKTKISNDNPTESNIKTNDKSRNIKKNITSTKPKISKNHIRCNRGNKCEDSECRFMHPKQCKFDPVCTNESCKFRHLIRPNHKPNLNMSLPINHFDHFMKSIVNTSIISTANIEFCELIVSVLSDSLPANNKYNLNLVFHYLNQDSKKIISNYIMNLIKNSIINTGWTIVLNMTVFKLSGLLISMREYFIDILSEDNLKYLDDIEKYLAIKIQLI